MVPQIITMALRRINFQNPKENILNYIPKHITLLPNTSGAGPAEEAVKIARKISKRSWLW